MQYYSMGMRMSQNIFAHLGQSLADSQLLHERMCEGCQATVLWHVSAYDSNLTQRFLHDRQWFAEGNLASVSWTQQLGSSNVSLYASLIAMPDHNSKDGLLDDRERSKPDCARLFERAEQSSDHPYLRRALANGYP